MTDQEISDIVHRVLRDRVPSAGFLGADVVSDSDFDGDPIIRVTAHYERRPQQRPNALLSAVHDLRSALIERGDDRFVFLTNDIAEERRIEVEAD